MINRILFSLAVAILSTSGFAQSFNVDMEELFAPPEGGRGVPSPTFGGAAGVPGVWNRINAGQFGINNLVGLDGNLTSVQLIGPDGGGAGSTNLPQNTGDYRALLNDAREVGIAGSVLNFRIEGLTNGAYRLYSYVGNISLPYLPTVTKVSAIQASTAPQFTTGEMPGNQFVRGNTHTMHELMVTNGVVNVSIETILRGSFFSGLQLVAVPEPATIFFLSACLFGLVRKRCDPFSGANS